MLSIEQMKKHIDVDKLETPVLVMDKRLIRKKYLEIKESIKGAAVYYAIKANGHPEILKYLAGLDAGFEVASTNELRYAPLVARGIETNLMGGTTIGGRSYICVN